MQQCPICKSKVNSFPRYPNYVCNDCIDKYDTLTWNGYPIKFSNEGFFGGFVSQVMGESTTGNVHKCYINGIECWADEARFGGIVIQPTRAHCIDTKLHAG